MEGQRKTYRAWDAQQNCHHPVSPRDALPENDLVFFLIDLIPQLDLTPFHEYYARELRGRPPFDVTMMVTSLVYAYAVGVCSSRKIAAACEPTWPSGPSSATTRPTSAPSATSARSTRRRSSSMPMDQYIREANDQTFLVIQLEDEQAVANAREIAEVEGVDVLFFGPADFTVLGGIPGQFDHPRVQAAIESVAKAAREAGKHWGMPCFSPEHGRKLMDLGAPFLCHGADIIFIKRGVEEIRRNFAPLGVTFDGKI